MPCSSPSPVHGLPGRFITFEGGEGAGKSSLAEGLSRALAARGIDVLRTREPGGSPLAERMRGLLLAGAFNASGPQAEAVMFALARSDHLSKTIVPALARGAVVLCDRFFDSTRAYQGARGGVGPELLDELEREAVGGCRPDLTLVLDLPVEVGLDRAGARRAGAAVDRFEQESLAFHEAVRQGFLATAAADPRRCRVLDATLEPAAVLERAWAHVAAAVGLDAPRPA